MAKTHRFWQWILIVGLLLSGFWSPPPVAAAAPPPPHNIRFTRLGAREGLSQGTVYCIAQDAQGFMWFGTQDGFNRYDGYTITIYRADPEDPTSLADAYIYACKTDAQGRLWAFSLGGGIQRYDAATDSFIRYAPPFSPTQVSTYNALAADRQGGVWLGVLNGGLARYDPAADRFQVYAADLAQTGALATDLIAAIHVDPAGTVWIGTVNAGLHRYDPATDTFIRYPYRDYPLEVGLAPVDPTDPFFQPDNPQALPGPMARLLFGDPQGRLWIGAFGGGLSRLDPGDATFTNYPFAGSVTGDDSDLPADTFSGNTLNKIVADGDGQLWLVSAQRNASRQTEYLRLQRVDPATGALTRFYDDPTDPCALASSAVINIFQTRAGQLWFHTYAGGLDVYDAPSGCFSHYESVPHTADTLADNQIQPFFEDAAGGLWFGGATNGLSFFDASWLKFPGYVLPDAGEGLTNNNVLRKIAGATGAGQFWLATDAGLNRWDPRTNTFAFNPVATESLTSGINDLWQTADAVVWIGTQWGLYRSDGPVQETTALESVRFTAVFTDVDPGSGGIIALAATGPDALWLAVGGYGLLRFDPRAGRVAAEYLPNPDDPQALSDMQISALYPAADGGLWVITGAGPAHFDPITAQFTTYPAPSTSNLVSLYETPTGLWAGAWDKGLLHLDPATGQWTDFGAEYPALRGVAYCVLPDETGALWISTNTGLVRFNPTTGALRRYLDRDGLQSNEFTPACYRAADGTLLFGGNNGFNAFQPAQVRDDPTPPFVVFTGLQLMNHPITPGPESFLKQPLAATPALALTYQERVVTFEFAALHYAAPDRNQYAYRLEGFDEDWNYVGNRRFATYTSLPPGRYTFRVKAANSDGVWNETGAALPITVAPPPWATWWAYTGYALLLVGAVAFYIQLRMRAQQRELERQRAEALQQYAQELEARNAELDAFAHTVAHDLKNPLSAVVGFSSYLLSRGGRVDEEQQITMLTTISRQGYRMARIIDELLLFASLRKLGEVALSPLNMAQIVAEVQERLAAAIEEKQAHLTLPATWPIPVGYAAWVEEILANYLSNALKYGGTPPHIVLGWEAQGEQLRFWVQDDGAGLTPEEQARLFIPFTRLDQVSAKGHGLGLSIVRRISEKLGGEVGVASAPGQGSTFWFTLPAAEAATARANPVEK